MRFSPVLFPLWLLLRFSFLLLPPLLRFLLCMEIAFALLRSGAVGEGCRRDAAP